jgi:1,4-alpha-glucan branching enzyme
MDRKREEIQRQEILSRAPAGLGTGAADCNDSEQSVLTFLRKSRSLQDTILIVCNFTPAVRRNYRIGVPCGGVWQELLNSDAEMYGGSCQGNMGTREASPVAAYDYFHSLSLSLPPLSIEFFKPVKQEIGETPVEAGETT